MGNASEVGADDGTGKTDNESVHCRLLSVS